MNLPTSHVGGTHDQIAVQLYAGATGVLMLAFHPEETLRFVSRYKVTILGEVPTMFRLIFQHCKIEEHDVSSLRLIFLGGEPSPMELIARANKNFPNATVVAGWGKTETAGFFTFTELTDEPSRNRLKWERC
ncbi:AMP-binding protein [Sporosarcina soli]|uniref:AMP-binding protein n=1 Tax=Sporosarcina soli TaxID=334736 RepID=A0ABW0TNW5_9BACL